MAYQKTIKLDHVERLSRGKSSGINVGSRAVGHYLRPYERGHYHRALKKGYLEIAGKHRANLWHIWEKACDAKNWTFLVLVKNTENAVGALYIGEQAPIHLELTKAKRQIQEQAARLNLSTLHH